MSNDKHEDLESMTPERLKRIMRDLKNWDPDETKGRKLYRARAETLANAQTNYKRRRVKLLGKPRQTPCLRREYAHMIQPKEKRDSRDPDYSREGIFQTHNCWKCSDGKKPCVNGHPHRCEYLHARND